MGLHSIVFSGVVDVDKDDPRSMVKDALLPRRSSKPFALILIVDSGLASVLVWLPIVLVLDEEKSCSVMISGRVLSVWLPEMLVLDAKRFRFVPTRLSLLLLDDPGGSKRSLARVVSFFGVFGMEKTSRTGRARAGSESRLIAFSLRLSVGVLGDLGDCTTKVGRSPQSPPAAHSSREAGGSRRSITPAISTWATLLATKSKLCSPLTRLPRASRVSLLSDGCILGAARAVFLHFVFGGGERRLFTLGLQRGWYHERRRV